MIRFFIAILALIAVSGCERAVRSQVSAFSKLQDVDVGGSVFILPYEAGEEKSLEWQTYASKLANRLRVMGYTVVSDPADAELAVFLGYAIDEGETVTSTYAIPRFGVTGYSGAQTYGTVGPYGNFSSSTRLAPTYGVTGYTTGSTTRTIYTRSMAVNFYNIEKNESVWEMQLSSSGSCGRIITVIDELIEAAFQGFPTSNGGTVEIPLNGKC